MKYHSLILCLFFLFSCAEKKQESSERKYATIKKTDSEILIDAIADEPAWEATEWQIMDQVWLGELQDSTDFSGRYKILWDARALYVLAEIHDDTLIDIYEDPLVQYWDDDCLEIFIDEDNSKGIHQYNHNAFAYHIALDGNVADIATDSLPRLYNDHIESKRITEGNKSTWEVAMKLFTDDYEDDGDNTPRELASLDKIGFAIAYCDNDTSKLREAFIGSEVVEGEDKNRGWIDAGIFRSCVLKEE